jgi:hypothetical protein
MLGARLLAGCLAGLAILLGCVCEASAGDLIRVTRRHIQPAGAAPIHKMSIQFGGYNKTDTLTNFPALVVFDTSIPSFSYSQFLNTNGYELRFKDSTELTNLNYEIDTWNTNANSYVWVSIPSFYSNVLIWAYWGDAANTNVLVTSTNGAVWTNANYRSVWHMNEQPTNLAWYADSSTTNPGKYFDPSGTASVWTNGVVGKATYFSGDNDYIKVTNKANFDLGANATIGFWVRNWPSANLYWVCKGDRNAEGWAVRRSGSYQVVFESQNGTSLTGSERSDWASWSNEWHYVTACLGGSSQRIYVNGLLDASNGNSGSLSGSGASFAIAAQTKPDDGDNPANFFLGGIDEVQVSTVHRSSNWVWASYMSIASNTVFANRTWIQ